jgi:hypothetical protein
VQATLEMKNRQAMSRKGEGNRGEQARTHARAQDRMRPECWQHMACAWEVGKA